MYIRDVLQGRQVWFQWLLHRPVPGASRFASSVHVPGHRVAKAVLVRAGEGFVLAVLPATTRIDLTRLSLVLDGIPITLATEDEVETVFRDCERGALPPFGRLYGVPTIVDASLAEGEEIVCVGNQRHEGLRIRYSDYELLERPTKARFAVSIPSAGDATNQLRAG
jgi:Ala-tRNA(Pro) deacylase